MKRAYLMRTENNRNENYAKKRFKVHIHIPSAEILCFELLKSRKL